VLVPRLWRVVLLSGIADNHGAYTVIQYVSAWTRTGAAWKALRRTRKEGREVGVRECAPVC